MFINEFYFKPYLKTLKATKKIFSKKTVIEKLKFNYRTWKKIQIKLQTKKIR